MIGASVSKPHSSKSIVHTSCSRTITRKHNFHTKAVYMKISRTKTDTPTLAIEWYVCTSHSQKFPVRKPHWLLDVLTSHSQKFPEQKWKAPHWLLYSMYVAFMKFPVWKNCIYLELLVNCIINGQRTLLVGERTRLSNIGSTKQTPCTLT